MHFWKYFFGVEEQYQGKLFARLLFSDNRPIGFHELAYPVDKYQVAGARKFFLGLVREYNRQLGDQTSIKLAAKASLSNPYQLGLTLAQKQCKVPEKAISQLIQGKNKYEAKAILRLLTEGYNQQLKTRRQTRHKFKQPQPSKSR